MSTNKEWVVAVGVANWKNEQLEVTIWSKKTDKKKIEQRLHEVLRKLYVQIVSNYTIDPETYDFRRADICMGLNDIMNDEVPQEMSKNVHYIFAKGRFMDKKRRSYFWPDYVLAEGDVTLKELMVP